MHKGNFLATVVVIEVLLILMVGLATRMGTPLFYLFYNGLYGLLLSTALPLCYAHYYAEPLTSLGLRMFGRRQLAVTIGFIVFSVGGQMTPIIINNTPLDLSLLRICFLPLLMTTFFEEMLFRGFIQTRLEQEYNPVVAIVLSGLLFSLYHLGYPGFRNTSDLLLLFAVGCGFGLAYRLSGNNLAAAYLVNLPNALLTYLQRSNQFPPFDRYTSVYAAITIVLIVLAMVWVLKIAQSTRIVGGR